MYCQAPKMPYAIENKKQDVYKIISWSLFLKALFGTKVGCLRPKLALKSTLIFIVSFSYRGPTPIPLT